MRLLILGFFLIVSFQSFSQKCKYLNDKTDPISGEVTRNIYFTYNAGEYTGIFQTGSSYNFVVRKMYSGEINQSVKKGQEISVKLGNNEILTLQSNEDLSPNTNVGGEVYTVFRIEFAIDKSQIQQIADHGISFVQLKINDVAPWNLEFKDKKKEKSQHKAACMLIP